MNSKLLDELLQSVREAGAILRGEMEPSRLFVVAGTPPEVYEVRRGYGLTQERFARMLGISVATLRNWEQGRRKPEGSARVLLEVAKRHPEALLDTVFGSGGRRQRAAPAAGGAKRAPRRRGRRPAAPK